MADAHKNFAYSTVATAPSPATSGTSLVVAAGDGTKFPTPPFNATVWPANTQPLTTNAEIVRVTAISTDTFTITRAQESSTAMTIATGYQVSASITVKTFTDIETTMVDLTSVQTLTNKTLDSPVFTTITYMPPVNRFYGTGSGYTVLSPASAASGTITLPAATDTLVGKATTDTLTNKTLTSPVITTGTVSADPSANLGIASKQYVDKLGTGSLVQNETPGGLVNGSNTAYTTASTFATGSLRVYLNGQRLTAGSGVDYVEATSGFTMQYAPATGDVLLVDYNVNNSTFIQGSNSIIVQETPTGTVNGTTTLFTVLQGKYVANTLEVLINGLQQTKTTDYTETSPGSGTFTFTTAPLTGDVVKVSYQFSTGASGNADTVDGIHASSTPTASTLVPLDSNARFDQATLPLGAVVQVVTTNYSAAATGTTQIPLDGTIPQSTEGDQYMSQTITPKSSTNLLVIEAYAMLSNTGAANSMAVALFQDSGASAIAVAANNLQGGTAGVPIPLKFSMTAGTTSATTFKIRAGYSTTGTTSFNATSGVANTYGTVPKSYIQITEYKA